MDINRKKREKALEKELNSAQKREIRLRRAAKKAKSPVWKTELASKIPDKVYFGLESAFCKAFSLVFNQGRWFVEKSYNKAKLQENQAVRDYAVQVKGGRKELKQVRRGAERSSGWNLALTTAEGIALGALGIGMPDIVLFISTVLKGIYETALNYGFEYESRAEQYIILKMMAASLSTGEAWVEQTNEIETLMEEPLAVTEEAVKAQIRETASVFAMDMLILKFIQGLPIVGIIGGAANPVYYRKVMRYVQLMYRKRYLLKQKK